MAEEDSEPLGPGSHVGVTYPLLHDKLVVTCSENSDYGEYFILADYTKLSQAIGAGNARNQAYELMQHIRSGISVFAGCKDNHDRFGTPTATGDALEVGLAVSSQNLDQSRLAIEVGKLANGWASQHATQLEGLLPKKEPHAHRRRREGRVVA